MSVCLSVATNDPVYRAALEHPKSTPAVKPRVLQQLAELLRRQAADLRLNWSELTPADRSWWVAWANDELPKSGGRSILGAIFVGFTLVNMIIHRDDALEFLTAGRILRRVIIELRSNEVWDAALADSDFVAASARGFDDIAAGRVSVVSVKDL